jgi:hypothetical protein
MAATKPVIIQGGLARPVALDQIGQRFIGRSGVDVLVGDGAILRTNIRIGLLGHKPAPEFGLFRLQDLLLIRLVQPDSKLPISAGIRT